MKVKALSRSKASSQRECVGDLRKHSRNLDPVYHPMQRPREMARAVTAAKMERMVRYTVLYSVLLTQFVKSPLLAVLFFLFSDLLHVRFVSSSTQSLRNHLSEISAMATKMPSIIPLFLENRYCRCCQGAQMEQFLCGICPRVQTWLP